MYIHGIFIVYLNYIYLYIVYIYSISTPTLFYASGSDRAVGAASQALGLLRQSRLQ